MPWKRAPNCATGPRDRTTDRNFTTGAPPPTDRERARAAISLVRRAKTFLAADALSQPARIPAENIPGQAADEEVSPRADVDPVAGAFHRAQNLARFDVDVHDAA